MCLLFLQILEVHEEYFSHLPKDLCHKVYDSLDVKSPRNESYIVDQFLINKGR